MPSCVICIQFMVCFFFVIKINWNLKYNSVALQCHCTEFYQSCITYPAPFIFAGLLSSFLHYIHCVQSTVCPGEEVPTYHSAPRLNFHIMVIDFFHWIELSINKISKLETKSPMPLSIEEKTGGGQFFSISYVLFHIFFIHAVRMDR